MSIEQLEKRVEALEKAMEQIQSQLNGNKDQKVPWWITQAGSFANDPVFDEIVRLGREYRQSLHPDYKKKKKRREAKKELPNPQFVIDARSNEQSGSEGHDH